MKDDSIQRILVVDDEPHMLNLLERIITEKTPYHITTTSNSLEVPDLLDKSNFGVVITDLKMPGIDGIDILKMIHERNRDEEVVIITAFGSLETASEALTLGVFDYITKPFRKEQIIATVERAMRWQMIKQECSSLLGIFNRESFSDSLKAFKKEYIHRLNERCNGDISDMLRRSELPEEEIREVLKELSE